MTLKTVSQRLQHGPYLVNAGDGIRIVMYKNTESLQ